MKLVVTGGAGFIGSMVVRLAAEDPENHIWVVDKMTYAATRASILHAEETGRVFLVEQDIGDHQAVVDLIAKIQPDAVMHLAAETHVDRSIESPSVFVDTNIVGTFNLLDASLRYWRSLTGQQRELFRFLHVSTDEVFGSLDENGRFDENSPYDPSSPYSASKAAADHLTRAWGRTYGLPVLISNCSNNYGPYQFPEKLIPLVVLNAIHGEALPVYGKGNQIRDWLFVRDHAQALMTVIRKGVPGHTYAVGGDCERTNLDVVEAICAIMDELRPRTTPHRDLIRFVEDRPGHDQRYAINAAKARADLGWQPVENLESGLRKTVLWYLQSEAWWRPLRRSVYGGERLGIV